MNRTLLAGLVLAMLTGGIALAQVDTLWFDHYQYSINHPWQYVPAGRNMAVDPGGNIYVCGYGQFKSDGTDLIVLKYSPSGRLLWDSYYESGGSDYAAALALDDAGAVYVTGYTYQSGSYSALTVKWDANGQFQWARTVSGNVSSYYNRGLGIAVADGAVYVAGQVANNLTGEDFALFRLDAASGTLQWLRTISRHPTPGYYECAQDVVVGAGEVVYVAGYTRSSVTGNDATFARYDKDGVLLWQQHYDGGINGSDQVLDIELREDLVVGTGYSYQAGGNDALTLAYRADGAFQWVDLYNGPGGSYDQGRAVAFDASGNVFVAGLGSGARDHDMLVVKYSGTGTRLWSRQLDGGGYDYAYCLDVDDWGGVAIGGLFNEGDDGFLAVVKHGSDGTQGWTYRARGDNDYGYNYATAVKFLGSQVCVAGMTYWSYPRYVDITALMLQEVPDVGVVAVNAPAGTVPLGTPVTPQAELRNNSLLPAGVPVRFEIPDGYAADTTVMLAASQSLVVDFPCWTPNTHGSWLASCRADLLFDYDRGNDTGTSLVCVPGPDVDAGVLAIECPSGNVRYRQTVVPAGRFKNFGTTEVDAWLFMLIDRGGGDMYRDSVFVPGFQPDGRDTTVEFRAWVADILGYFYARCSTWTDGDEYPANDSMRFQFGVVNQPVGYWTSLCDVPTTPSGKQVYYGGGLAATDTALFCLKGNKTYDVYSYSIQGNSWRTLESLPHGLSARPVSKGGRLASDPYGRLYAVKGNRTFEFYGYDPVLGWQQLADIPPGARGKSPKGGTGLEYVETGDTGYVYLLKGSNLDEFFRYNILTDSWQGLPAAPAGLSGKSKYNKGSSLTWDGDSILYCLKGKYNEVFAFDVRAGSWIGGQLPDVPLYGSTGRKKKVKQGGDIEWAGGFL
ncbi:hypothetical protein JXB37_00405, partial [candidate division WOR-3 bacterium]|nr:hypothetical protein [candidate division WOR-3 bacterium]